MIAKIEFRNRQVFHFGGTSVELVGSAVDVSTVMASFGAGAVQEEDVPALSQEERERLTKAFNDGYRWIGRDSDGEIFVFDSKPAPIWSARSSCFKAVPKDLFQAIKAPVCEPYEIKALLDSALQKEEK